MASSVAPTDESTSTVSKSDYEAMKFWNVLNEQTDPKMFGQGERQRVFHLRKLVLERIFLIKPPSGCVPVSHKAFGVEMENLDKKLQFRALTTQHLQRIMASSGTGPAEVYEMKMKYAATSEMLQRMLVEEMGFSPAFAKSVAKRNSAMVKAMKGSNKSGGRDTSSLNLGISINTLLQIENTSDLKQLREMGFFMHTSGAAPTRDSISRKSDMTHISSASRDVLASDHAKQASTMSRTTSPAALSSPTAIVQAAPGVKVSVTGQPVLQQQQNQNLLPDTTTSDADTEQSGLSSSYNPKEGPSSSRFPQNYTSSAMQLQKKGTLSGEKLSLARDLVAAASTVVVDKSSATGGVAPGGASSAQNAAAGAASSQQQQGAGTRKTGASNETDDQVIVINPGGPNSSMSSFLEVDFPLAAAQHQAEGEVIEYEHNIVRSSSGDAPAELHVMDLGAFQTLAANGPHNMRYPTSHYATSHMTSQTDSSTEKHSSRRISSSRRSDVSHEEVLLKGGKYTYGPSNETHEGEVLNQLNSEGEIENFPEGEIGTVEGEQLGQHNRAKELLQRAQQHAGGQKTLQELRNKRNNPKNLLSSPAANYSSNASAVSSNSNISTDHDKHENETETEKQFRENAEFDFWLWNRVFVQVYRMFDVNRNTIMQIPTGALGPTDASAWPPIEHGADPTRDAGYRFTRDSGLSRATATPSVVLVDKERRSLESGLSARTSITLNPNIPKSGQIFELPPPVVADHTDFSRKTNMTQGSTRRTSGAGGLRVVSVSINASDNKNPEGAPTTSSSSIRPSNQTTLPPQQAPAERTIYTESLLTGDITNSEKLSFDVKPSQFVSGGTKQKSVAIGGESVINKTSTSTQDNDIVKKNSTVVARSTDTASSSRSQILMGQTPTAMHVNTPYATNAVPRSTAGANSSTSTTPFATQNAAGAGTSVVPAGAAASGPSTTATTRNTNPARSSSTYNGNNNASMAPPPGRTSGSFLPPGAGQTMLGSLPEGRAVISSTAHDTSTGAAGPGASSTTIRRTSNESNRSTNARAPSAAVSNSYGNNIKGGNKDISYNSTYGAGKSSSKKGGKSARRSEGSATAPNYLSNYHSTPLSSYQYGQQWGMKSGKGGKEKGKGGFYQ